jgi:hypothetical protein
MNLVYQNPGLEYMVQSIAEFQSEDQSESFRDSLYYFFPQFDKAKMNTLSPQERADYIRSGLQETYAASEALLDEKLGAWQRHWDAHRSVVEQAFENIFELPLADRFNDMTGNISFNPVCPRYLETRSFDVFYLNSERGALGMALHEIAHFVWFEKWQAHFCDDPKEYDTPHLKWIFSEMVVESLLSDERLKPLNPYAGHCVYDCFYTLTLDGKPALEALEALYRQHDIISFMEQGYAFCQRHEAAIRAALQ